MNTGEDADGAAPAQVVIHILKHFVLVDIGQECEGVRLSDIARFRLSFGLCFCNSLLHAVVEVRAAVGAK